MSRLRIHFTSFLIRNTDGDMKVYLRGETQHALLFLGRLALIYPGSVSTRPSTPFKDFFNAFSAFQKEYEIEKGFSC